MNSLYAFIIVRVTILILIEIAENIITIIDICNEFRAKILLHTRHFSSGEF